MNKMDSASYAAYGLFLKTDLDNCLCEFSGEDCARIKTKDVLTNKSKGSFCYSQDLANRVKVWKKEYDAH